jgi:hypothetical protein
MPKVGTLRRKFRNRRKMIARFLVESEMSQRKAGFDLAAVARIVNRIEIATLARHVP